MKFKRSYIGFSDAISPLAQGVDSHIKAMLEGKSAYGLFDKSIYGNDFPVKYSGQIPSAWFDKSLSRNHTKAELILDYLISRFKATTPSLNIDAILLLYKTVHPFECLHYQQINQNNFYEKNDQDSVHKILAKHNIQIQKDNIYVIDNTCSTGLTLLSHASQAIEINKWNNVLVCAIDLMDAYRLYSLNSIGAFASKEMPAENVSRPFDQDRNGFVKTESGSLALITSNPGLFSDEHHFQLLSFHQTNDAYKLTDGREDNLFIKRAMEVAIHRSGLEYNKIAFVKSHGTSTMLNDAHEAEAILEVFKHENVPVTSLKGHLGHTTDASGLIENLIAAKALSNGLVLPTKNFSSSELKINVVHGKALPVDSKYFLSNSFGFGGNNISAVFEVIS